MANNQAAFNATIVALQQNQISFASYLSDGVLNLNNQGITDADCISLANALKNNTSVQVLYLGSNSISDSGASALAQALQVNTALQLLDLRENSIGASGAGALAQALQANRVLQSLYLGGNSIGDSGSIALAQALQVNTGLQYLNLNFNSIGDSGAIAITQALQLNTALLVLVLQANSIGDSGAIALAQALQINTQLQSLDLTGNSIDASGANAFTQALQCNYVLYNLYLDITLPAQLSAYLQRNTQCAGQATPRLQCPILIFEPPATIFPNATIPLTSANLRITSVYSIEIQSTQTLLGNFTVSNATHGDFVNSAQQVLSEFSQPEVNASQVFIKTDSSGLPFSCNITASYGNLSTCAIPLLFNVSMTTTTSITTSTTTSRPFTTTRTPKTTTSIPTSSTLPLTTSSSFFPTTTTPSTTSMSRTSTSVVKNPGGGARTNNTNLGAIIGGVVGGVAGVAAVGVGMFLLNRRRHKRTAQIAALPAHVTRNDVAMMANPVYVRSAVNTAADVNDEMPNSVYAGSADDVTDMKPNSVYASSNPTAASKNTWDPSAYVAQPAPMLPARKK